MTLFLIAFIILLSQFFALVVIINAWIFQLIYVIFLYFFIYFWGVCIVLNRHLFHVPRYVCSRQSVIIINYMVPLFKILIEAIKWYFLHIRTLSSCINFLCWWILCQYPRFPFRLLTFTTAAHTQFLFCISSFITRK